MCADLPQVCNMTEGVYVEKHSESEMLIVFITSDGDGTARNISKWHKIM